MNGYLKDETEELGPSPYTRAYPSTYPAPAPPPSGTPRRTRTLSTPRKGVRLQRVCHKILYLWKIELDFYSCRILGFEYYTRERCMDCMLYVVVGELGTPALIHFWVNLISLDIDNITWYFFRVETIICHF